MTVCVISQPRLFPGLHYLDRMRKADVFVVFDTVQFNPRHEENRFRVKADRGPEWLTASVEKGPRERVIQDVRLNASVPWGDDCKRTLERLYGDAPRYEENIEEIHAILDMPHERLVELDVASWGPALRAMQPACEFVRASELGCEGKGPQLLLDICKRVGADVYLSGGFGREYLEPDAFQAAGVEVRFHEYEPQAYPQRRGEFAPFLSYVDMMFECGLGAACAT